VLDAALAAGAALSMTASVALGLEERS